MRQQQKPNGAPSPQHHAPYPQGVTNPSNNNPSAAAAATKKNATGEDGDDDDDNESHHRMMQQQPFLAAEKKKPSSSHGGAVRALFLSRTLQVIGLRLLSFVGTQWTFRRLRHRPQVLGQSSVRLDLLLTSILFLSREGFRLALTRLVSSDNQGLIWASIPVTTLLAILAAAYHWCSTRHYDADFAMAGVLYCLAAFIEGLGEPPVLLAMRTRLSIAEKAAAETLAGLVKTLIVALLLEPTIVNFGIAQCAYAVVYTVFLYYVTIASHHRQSSSSSSSSSLPLWPPYQWHGPTVRLALLFNLQGLFKHVLTQGDRIVLTMVANEYDQGVYAMGSAYGGLAARLLLQPMEESARLLFSRAVSDHDADGDATTTTTADLETLYTSCVKVVLYIGLIFSCLAVNYTQILLQVLAGWGDHPEAVATLSAFCVYTAALAWNGMTEACMYGIAKTGRELRNISIAHTAIGVVFVAVAPWAVTRGGTVALVGANTLSMMARALFAIYFVADSMKSKTAAGKNGPSTGAIMMRLVAKMTPPHLVLLAFATSYVATRMSRLVFDPKTNTGLPLLQVTAQHIGVGAACGVGILTLAYTVEKQLLRDLRRLSVAKQD
jgi:oligosaccharide translocation protein RFT1